MSPYSYKAIGQPWWLWWANGHAHLQAKSVPMNLIWSTSTQRLLSWVMASATFWPAVGRTKGRRDGDNSIVPFFPSERAWENKGNICLCIIELSTGIVLRPELHMFFQGSLNHSIRNLRTERVYESLTTHYIKAYDSSNYPSDDRCHSNNKTRYIPFKLNARLMSVSLNGPN